MKIELFTKETIASRLAELAGLLADAVHHGASVGFVLPLADDEVGAYWRKVWADVDAGQRLLISAIDEAGRLVGSAQLALEPRANGRHRAEVQKVMVLASHRGCGIGAALMARVEAEARAHGRLLLHLDTSVGDGGATRFYDRLGYAFVGGIPDFAANPDGSFAANAIYYKRLSVQAPGAPAGLSLNR